MATVKKIKKAQVGTKEGKGTYFAFPNGRVGRTYPIYKDGVEYQSMDTTGYSKGKKNFDLTTSSTLGTNSKSIPREEVPGKINEMKKGTTRTQEYKKPKKSAVGSKISKAKDGKWIQKATASIKKRGTAGKCTPITKPGCTGRAKALAKTFKKMAKARK
jgi:hypothetical protein